MRALGISLGMLGLITFGQSTKVRADYTLATAAPISNYNSTPVSISGSSITPLALTTIYSNTTNFTGFGFANGGAGTATQFGNTTAMAADDITPAAGFAGTAVSSITFSVANLNAATVTAGVQLYFYGSNAAGTAPTTFLGALSFTPISFAAGTVGLYTYTANSTLFTAPTGTFFVGESFSDAGGTTGATTAQLNGLGEGLFNPPTTGTSNDYFFESSTNTNLTSNPSGGLEYFGGSPVANFGFAFSGTPAAVPEPSSLILTSLAGVVLVLGKTRGAKFARRLLSR